MTASDLPTTPAPGPESPDPDSQRAFELETILRVSRAVASTLDLDELMRMILEQLRLVIDYDCASLILTEGNHLLIQDIVMPHEREFRRENRLRFTPIEGLDAWAACPDRPPLDTPCVLLPAAPEFWAIMEEGRQHVMADALSEETDALAGSYRRMMGDRLHARDFMRSWMATPLHGRAGTIGYFGTSSAAPSKFTERHMRLARIFADQATIAIENARLFRRAQDAAVLQERHRVARDLHDYVAQSLYGVALGARAARRYMTEEPSSAEESLDYVVELATAGLAEMRALIFDLYPDSIRKEGLKKAIEHQLELLPARFGIAFEFRCDAEPVAADDAKEALYGVVREALHNAVKHSGTDRLSVELSEGAGEIRFAVRDYGSGFVLAEAAGERFGLRSMQDRMAEAGGRLSIESKPGEGTLVGGSLPAR